MKTNAWNDLIHQVEEQGVVVDSQLAKRMEEENSIKYVFLKVVVILGSLLAMGFFFGFLFVTIGKHLDYLSFLVMGVLLYSLSLLGNKKAESAWRDGVFVATYISAVVCFIAACVDFNLSDENTLLCFSILSCSGFFLFKSKLIQFLSVLSLYYGLVYYLGLVNLSYLGQFLFWIVLGGLFFLFDKELEIKTTTVFWSKKYNALCNATFFILFFEIILDNLTTLDSTSWLNSVRYGEYSELNHYISMGLSTLVLVLLIYCTGKKINKTMAFSHVYLVIGLGGLFLVGAVFLMHGFGVPLAISLLLLLWSYHFCFQKGVVLALALLVFSLICYYYFLDVSLLVKSLILMGCGLFFLSLFVINMKLNREK